MKSSPKFKNMNTECDNDDIASCHSSPVKMQNPANAQNESMINNGCQIGLFNNMAMEGSDEGEDDILTTLNNNDLPKVHGHYES